MRRAVLVSASVLGVIIALIAIGALVVFYYTLPPSPKVEATPNTGSYLSSARPPITVLVNGTNYQVPAKGPNSPTFQCPAGTAPSLCTLLVQTCGNGVGPTQEPWKTCNNCIFDAGCTGNTSCDPYTHRCSTPATACMVAIYAGNGGA